MSTDSATTDAASGEPRIVDVPHANRYELWVGEDRVGFSAYRREPGRVMFTHTVVDPAHEGHGYGSAIARAVIEDAVQRGETIVPRCPFIAAWLEKHPDAATDIEWPDSDRP
ncbi:GNAT family N-acetyltransferase [Labedella endophytica]|uniref:N-acetyltransferase n=1 Tax=Labedella endophytica TaxID=1523160 RepID=A0A3S0X146_9MICO|nr:GNAT family N-acetyltransferase [Labedella endophytica]RUR03462.1 N-acetyltransferase [Labedella endophytica]